MAAETRSSLRDALMSALADATEYRTSGHAICADCGKSRGGVCPEDEGDAAKAAEYQRVRAMLEGLDTTGVTSLLAGTEA